MAADKEFTNGLASTKAPPFEELNFKKFKKFFLSFLMRHDRAHQAILEKLPTHISELNKRIPREQPMTQAQAKKVKQARKKWRRKNEIAYSFLMEVCNAHPKASTTAALSNQTGAEFVDSVEAQAKILENLGRRVSDDDKLTRLKEGLTDKRYTHLAHSLAVISVIFQAIQRKIAFT